MQLLYISRAAPGTLKWAARYGKNFSEKY